MLEELPTVSAKVDDGTFTCFDLLKCLFNLSDKEIEVLRKLPEGKARTATQVAKLVNRDRSTAYRALEKLVACSLVVKERRGGKTRGFSNVYHRVSDRELYIKADENLDRCYGKIKKVLKETQPAD